MMAVTSKHAVTPAPTAPVRERTGHLLMRGYCILLLFTALATTAWYNLIGPWGLTAMVMGLAVVSIVIWIRPPLERDEDGKRPRVEWRRLPWFVMAYVAWAAASVIWTAWLGTTILTWSLMAATTLQGLFVASVLTWRELVRSISGALKWVMGLSILFELWVAIFVQAPVLPNFVEAPADIPPELYWSRDNLFDGGRIQGIVGNSNLLAIAALLAIIVFAIRYAARAPRRGILIAWMVLSAYLFWRAQSATAWLAAIAVAIVLATALLMRTARKPGDRTRWYVVFVVIGIGGAIALWLLRDTVFAALGRSADLTGREEIWATVLDKAAEHPVIGWGFATPWIPWDPAFQDWIIDHDLTVFHAHNMWVDAYFQLGAIGLGILILTYLAYIWRSWFFAVDRPRWDLKADRPYRAQSLLPTLVGAILLVQGMAESRPLMEWGWMFLAMLAFKLKQSPVIGFGPAEQTLAIERGEAAPADGARTPAPARAQRATSKRAP